MDIVDYMITTRGPDRGSALVGKSTHNQRIERLWRDVFDGVLCLYYNLFYFLEDQGLLDPLNEAHLAALHFVYLPIINDKLQVWSSAWSHHRMRTTRSTPIQMWVSGQLHSPTGINIAADDIASYGVEGTFRDASDDSDTRPVLEPLNRALTEPCSQRLSQMTSTLNNYGIERYLEAISIITSNSN